MLTAALDVVILMVTAVVSYGMARLAARSEIATLQRGLDLVGKGNLRANIFAERAVEVAARAEEKATEARDLAESAIPSRVAVPADE